MAMNNDNSLKLVNFLKNWDVDFETVIYKSICDSIGYSLHDKFAIRILDPASSREKYERAKEELDALERFQKGFITICQKSNILRRYLSDTLSPKDFDYVGEGLSEWHPYAGPFNADTVGAARRFNLLLEEEIRHAKNKLRKCATHDYPTKQRIPIDVAFEILRALCFCSGNATTLKQFEILLLPNNSLDKTAQRVLADIKNRVLKSLDEEAERKMENRKEYTAPLTRKKIKERMLEEKEEYRRVKEVEISWLPFKHRGEPNNTRWANHLKDHLIKTILSSKEPTIRKSFKGVQRKKMALLKKVEEKNRATIGIIDD